MTTPAAANRPASPSATTTSPKQAPFEAVKDAAPTEQGGGASRIGSCTLADDNVAKQGLRTVRKRQRGQQDESVTDHEEEDGRSDVGSKNPSGAGGNHRPLLVVSESSTASSSMTAAATTMTVQSAQAMTADEYMRLVSEQAKSLPDVFVVSRPSPTSTTTATEGGDRMAGANASRRRTTNLSTKRRRRSNDVPIDGCAASMWHMLGGSGDNDGDEVGVRSSSLQNGFFLGAPTVRHLPANPREWVDHVLYQFSTLRQYLERLHSFKADPASNSRVVTVPSMPRNRIPVPAMKDRSSWIRFCVGGSSHCALDSEKDASGGDGTKKGNKTAWLEQLPPGGYAPEVSLLLQLDQVMTRAVLSHLTEFFIDEFTSTGADRNGSATISMSTSLCAWLYGLLARLEKPLHRNDASTLFQLLKQLTKARYRWSPVVDAMDADGDHDAASASRTTLAHLNVLIATVGIYFEQGGYHAVMTCTEGRRTM